MAAWAVPTALYADGNRLTYLDAQDPYYASRDLPVLATPQWIGEPGVEAVVVLAIDDMRGHDKWEAYLRPIIERLKKIDGRAPVSIMTNDVRPDEPHLQQWLAEGLSLETHTKTHPCPLLAKGDLAASKKTFDDCVDQMAAIPRSKPVAFRMPCCDSLNTVSPRFFSEIFNSTTPAGNYLAIDSSVFQLFTANDPRLPRDRVLDGGGRERFRRYLPADRAFVNRIDDYPYPYVIGRLCWEFPCIVPSDWESFHLQGANSPRLVADLQAALDCAVAKQGTFTLVFHPHDWIKSEQIIELIDHAVSKHGGKVKFLNFREALERLEKNLLGGQSLRAAPQGGDNGVRLLDLDQDHYLDVVVGNDNLKQTRVWSPQSQRWIETEFPCELIARDSAGNHRDSCARFGVVRPDGAASVIVANDARRGAWTFRDGGWKQDDALLAGLSIVPAGRPSADASPVMTGVGGRDHGVRLRDLDRDGVCELIVGNDKQQAIFGFDAKQNAWHRLPFILPEGTAIVDDQGRDAGLRFVDVDEDAYDDVVFSNDDRYSLDLFHSIGTGWSRRVLVGKAGDSAAAIPRIVSGGTNNGAWFAAGHMYVVNERTDKIKELVDQRSFATWLKDIEPEAKSPAASLRALRARPGFTVDLVAAEPLLVDPVAFDWGPDGRLWVAEMRDYPTGMDADGKPGGVIKCLEDTDEDGHYDRATEFLTDVAFPNGVKVWRKGIIVTCAPDILYAEDTDGDGRADVREVLLHGFGEGNQQHRVNGLTFGLDNWLHCANGDSGGQIESTKTGDKVPLSFRDFRFQPDDGRIDLLLGQSQFTRVRDDAGNWFGCSNSEPLYQFVLEDRYLRRNRQVAAPNARIDVSAAPGAAPVFPLSRTLPRFNDLNVVNRFTSACGATVYRDDLFGAGFIGNSYVSEPVHNLVHREVMTRDGVRYTSRRADDEQQSEFLASSDNWFRPTMLRTGPDGALWVADMYRAVIEHPEYIPVDWQKRLNLRAGDDMGRIYRVYPVDRPPRKFARLDRLDIAGLVAALVSPNGWQRDMAQQMLVWRDDRAAVPLLKQLIVSEPVKPAEKDAASGPSTSVHALARVHALCTLDGLRAIDEDVLLAALEDTNATVRRHAIRLAEPWFARSPLVAKSVQQLADDTNEMVRLQLAYSLGEWADPRAGETLGAMAVADLDDVYISAAIVSSIGRPQLDGVVQAVLAKTQEKERPAELLQKLLTLATMFENHRSLVSLLAAVAVPQGAGYAGWQIDSLAGLLDTLDRKNLSLAKFRSDADAHVQAGLDRIRPMFAWARDTVKNEKAAEADRLAALALLARGFEDQQQDIDLLAGLLTPRSSAELQSATVAALARLDEPRIPTVLLAGWKGYGAELRGQVLDALLRRESSINALLDNVDSGQIHVQEIDASRRQRLREYRDKDVHARVDKLFASDTVSSRQAIIDQYRAGLATPGDATRGKAIFKKTCSVCHRLEDVGTAVGPDLAALTDKSSAALLVAILDPNRAVESKFVSYAAVTTAGLTYTGMLAAETGASITLVGQEGKQTTILRSDLEELAASGRSLMPEGMEKDIPPRDFADLIAYLSALRPPRRVFAGNEPKVVEPEGFRGEFWLLASDCEIYGDTLAYEPVYRNLGMWGSTTDHAVWTFDVKKAAKYVVRIDYACDEAVAGNPYQLTIGDTVFAGKVPSTGNWDTYRQLSLGRLSLKPGRYQVVLRPDGAIAGALMDLKSVRITPVGPD
ncbi:MAG TPA: PVC-type heme-binding CxxCH protein [Pirellulales bacterium]|nr:PVC-type heme-binding CxxCH protein [Pirellulales bacterium]